VLVPALDGHRDRPAARASALHGRRVEKRRDLSRAELVGRDQLLVSERHASGPARRHADKRADVHAHAEQLPARRGGREVDARGADLDPLDQHCYEYSIPSCTRWSSSIATSPPPFAASVGPTHFLGWARWSRQVATACRASSMSVIVMSRG